MNNFYMICCYYYLRQALRITFNTLAAMALAFMIHKLVSWALWVMSL